MTVFWGILGAGKIAESQMAPAIAAARGHELAAVMRRELGAVRQPRALIRSLPGVELVEMEYPDECCGFGGTFSVKFADISGAMLADKLDRIEATGADAVTACDSSCLMQIEGGLRKRGSPVRAVHLAELIDAQAPLPVPRPGA